MAGMEHHFLSDDVIAKTPAADSEPVLALAMRDSLEFEDLMATAPVVGIAGKNGERFSVAVHKLRVALEEGTEYPLKAGGGTDGKRRRHDC